MNAPSTDYGDVVSTDASWNDAFYGAGLLRFHSMGITLTLLRTLWNLPSLPKANLILWLVL